LKYSDYLQKRWEYLRTCDIYVEDKLEEDKQKLVQKVNENELKSHGSAFRNHLDEINIVADTFRYSMLVAVCTFLEESIKFITRQLIKDYKSKLKITKQGSWLSKHLELLASCAGLEIKSIESQKILFNNVILIRNTIAHAWGKVEASKSPKKLRDIISQYDWININDEGFIILDDQTIPNALVAALEIIEHILQIPSTDSINFSIKKMGNFSACDK
jgi:hypothetical protein